MALETDEDFAREIAAFIGKAEDPSSVTVQDIAAEFGEPEDRVVKVVEEYRPDGEHVGPGLGGGWVEYEPPAAA